MERQWTPHVGCGGLKVISFKCSRSIVLTSVARSAGSRSRVCSCVRVMEVLTTETDREPRVHQSGACSSIRTKWRVASSRFRQENCLLRAQAHRFMGENRHVPDWSGRGMVRQAATTGGSDSERRRPSSAQNSASWFYVFGSAALTIFMLQIV